MYTCIYAVFWFLFWDSLTCGAIYEEHPYAKAGRDGGCRGCWLLLDTAAVVAVEEKGACPLVPWFCFAPQSMQRLLVLCTETNK